jgi:pilus assembly protein CpaB
MGDTKEHVTRLLLARVSVIAIGSTVAGATSTAPADGSSGGASSSSNGVLVTVALRQHDAEKLILASQTGTLYLGLLNQASQVTPGPGANNTNLFQ